MELATCARPYARAVFEYAKQERGLSDWSDMLSLCSAVVSNDKMVDVFANPSMSGKQQAKMLIGLCEGCFTRKMNNYITILSESRRINLLPAIHALFEQLKAEEERYQDVLVTSAFPLTQNQIDKLSKKIEVRLDRCVHLKVQVDSSLIGGVIIKAGDMVIDGSLRARLIKLADETIS